MPTPRMQAVIAAQAGGPEQLQVTERPRPEPAPGEVLIRVIAAGVNRPDILQRRGLYPPPSGASDILGLEVSGQITKLGSSVTGWKIGDTVTALVAGGGYAEYCVAPAAQLLPIPIGLNFQAAAALPEAYFTVWTNLFERGRLQAGERVLIHGGSSGIGTTAIQLAKLFGAIVFTTAGSDEKCQACLTLGADRAIHYKMEDFAAIALKESGGAGMDVILDMVGGAYIARNLDLLAVEGRLIFIAFQKGSIAEVDFRDLMVKRQTITGSTLRPQSIAAKGRIASALREKVWPALATGQVRPVLDRIFPLKEAAAAHRHMESGNHIGKIILTVQEPE